MNDIILNDVSSELATGLLRKDSNEYCLICLCECESRNNTLSYHNPECTCIYFIHKECMDEWRLIPSNCKKICILCKTEEIKEVIAESGELTDRRIGIGSEELPQAQADIQDHIIIVHQYHAYDIYSRVIFRLLMMCFLVLIIVIYMVVFIVIKSL